MNVTVFKITITICAYFDDVTVLQSDVVSRRCTRARLCVCE